MSGTSSLKEFSFQDLKMATRNLSPDCLLGEGRFGRVYKGWVHEKTLAPSKTAIGMAIAIKISNPANAQGFQEWQSEVNFLGRNYHPNIIGLLGYCWEDQNLVLVYEFMHKGSLENYLFPSVGPLSWDIRLKIAIGAARGLAFLHNLEKKIIYRDLKASNILLDKLAKSHTYRPAALLPHMVMKLQSTLRQDQTKHSQILLHILQLTTIITRASQSHEKQGGAFMETTRKETKCLVFCSFQMLLTPNMKEFSFEELKMATRNFGARLGDGGLWKVYNGWLDEKRLAPSITGDGIVVAIKDFNTKMEQHFEMWQSEVNFLGRHYHPNLIGLFGYCLEDEKLLLVYEFVQKGRLDTQLFTRNCDIEPLSWDIRLKIAIGAA
ncbi:hypothetical protein ACOSP7_022520 [Xanthoceras sorbifolium]